MLNPDNKNSGMESVLYFGMEAFESEDDIHELPMCGFASYEGQPHFINFCADKSKPPGELIYGLTPLTNEIFTQVEECVSIWRKWTLAYHSGEIELNTHPMRPEQNDRYVELISKLNLVASHYQPHYFSQAKFRLSDKWLKDHARVAGKKWPIPGTYSAEYVIDWTP